MAIEKASRLGYTTGNGWNPEWNPKNKTRTQNKNTTKKNAVAADVAMTAQEFEPCWPRND